jgi:hypothetical protein
MAKETKAERTLREATESMARQAEERATYPARLLAWLERAQDANFELRLKDGMYLMSDRDERYAETVVLAPFYTEQNEAALNGFTWTVTYKAGQTAEANRKFLAKQSALAKLSKEEKELLGL